MTNVAVELARALEGPRPSLVVGARTTSRGELGARVRGLAGWLHRRGVAAGERAAVLVPAGPELVATVLALQWLGAVPVLADPDQPADVFDNQARAAEPRWVVAAPWLARAWRFRLLRRALAAAGRELPRQPAGELLVPPSIATGEVAPVSREAGDEALIVFTSGTTSRPRGVVHTHGSVAAFLANVRAAVGGLGFASYVAETPPQLFYGLALDAMCHVAAGRGEARVRALWNLLESRGAEAWFGGPWLWARWLREGRRPPPLLRALVFGAAPVSAAFLRELLAAGPPSLRVLCLYGLTESGPVATVDGRAKADWCGPGDLVGRVLPNLRLDIVDGEIRVAGPAVAPRYLGGPALVDGVATGDLGRLDGETLMLLGRSKDMIVRRGVNIYPGLYEPLLARSHGDVALVGVFDAVAQDERVVLCCTSPAGPLPALREVAPDHLLALEALPRRGRQRKLDREALRRLARERFAIPG